MKSLKTKALESGITQFLQKNAGVIDIIGV